MATTFHTAKTGANSNSGLSLAAAFLTIAKGLSVMSAGDTLDIHAGTYTEPINSGTITIPTGSSWSNAPIIRAFQNDLVTIRGGSTRPFALQNSYVKYVIFSGLMIDGQDSAENCIRIASGAHHVRFQDCVVKNSVGQGLLISGGSVTHHHEILRCEFFGHGKDIHFDHGLYITGADNLVEDCDVHDNIAYGVHVYDSADHSAHRNMIRRVKSHDNGEYGILVGSGTGNVVQNCLVYNNGTATSSASRGGIQVGFTGCVGNKILNNTVYNNGGKAIEIRNTASGTILKNNIFYLNTTGIDNQGSGTVQSNNLLTNPSFVNAGAGDFHLQAGSPAINVGATLSEVPTDYDLKVRPSGASYDIGAYEYGSTVVTPPPPATVPAAPSGLYVTMLSSSALRVNLTDNANNESGYEIERSLTGFGGWAKITTTGANVTTYTDSSGLTALTTYYYRARAINSAGPSPYSNIANAATDCVPSGVPAAPSGLAAIAVSATRIDLGWIRNATDETSVGIERAVSPFTSFAQITTRGATVITYSDTGRTPATEYAYRVRNINSAGPSAYSNVDNATTDAVPGSPPSAPLDLIVEVISHRQIDLMWANSGGADDGVRILRSEDAITFAQIAEIVGTGLTYYSDMSCIENTTYFYYIILYNEAGVSAESNITNATTPDFDGPVFTENQLRSLAGFAPFPDSETGTVEYWRHLAGFYRGPFDALTVVLSPPDPGIGIITLLDIHATNGPFYYSSFEPEAGADQYHGRILANVSITKEQPDPYNGIPGRREAQVELSNLNVNPEAPTMSEIELVQDPIGLYAPVRLYDLTEEKDMFRLDGKITSYQPGIATASVTIAIDEPKILETPLPKKRTAEVFPDLDLSTFSRQDPVVNVVCGPWRKAPIGLCRTDNLTYWDYGAIRKATAGLVSVVNVYRNGAYVSSDEYTIVEPVTGYLCVRFTLDQMDRGQPLPIVVDLTTTEFSQNPAQVIKFLLSNAGYGLGQTVDNPSFSLAAIDFATIPIRIGGGLSEQQDARVILRDLLLHGAFLDRTITGAYTLTVDTLVLHPQHEDANFQLGFGLEDWHNIPNDPAKSVRDESQRLKELVIEGGWDPYFNGNGSYHVRTIRTRAIAGATKKLSNRFLLDGSSTDRQTHYLWGRTNARDKQVPIDSDVESYVLDVGHLVKTTIPTMQLDHTVMEVIRRTSEGGTSIAFSYLLAPWDATAFSYVAGVIEQDRYADTLLDYRRTPPTQPTNFQVNGGTRSGEASLTESRAILTAERVFYNITHVKFVGYRTGSAVPIKEIEVRAPAADIGIDPTVTGEIEVFPGLAYDFECYAVNKENDADRQESSRALITNFVAPGDTIPPGRPLNLYAKRGSLRTVFLTWTATPDEAKLREYVVERDTSGSFDTAIIVANVKTTNYADTDTPYDATLYYRVKAVSRAGLSSLWSNTAVMVVVRALPSDYGKDSQYRYHRAPLSQIVYIVTVPANSSFAFTTGIDAKKYEWQAGMLGVQATTNWNGTTPGSGGVIDGTRLMEFIAGGGISGPFSPDFDIGVWNGTAEELVTVIQASGS